MGDLVSLMNVIWFTTQVLHKNNDLATITRVDHPGVAQQSLLRHAGAGLDDVAGGWNELNCDSRVYSCRAVRRNGEVFTRVEVVADALSGMRNGGQDRSRREPLHFEHGLSLCQMRRAAIKL